MMQAFAISLFLVAVSISVIDGAPTKVISNNPPEISKNQSRSILEEIIIDDGICPTSNALLNSTYLKECGQLQLPVANTNITLEPERFLCSIVYDRFHHICHGRSLERDFPILRDQGLFDSAVAEEVKKTDVLRTCEAFELLVPALYNKTREFVHKIIEMVANNPEECVTVCKQIKQKAKPLCVVIQVIEEQLRTQMVYTDSANYPKIKAAGDNLEPTTVKPISSNITPAKTDLSAPQSLSEAEKPVNPAVHDQTDPISVDASERLPPNADEVDAIKKNRKKTATTPQSAPENAQETMKAPKVANSNKQDEEKTNNLAEKDSIKAVSQEKNEEKKPFDGTKSGNGPVLQVPISENQEKVGDINEAESIPKPPPNGAITDSADDANIKLDEAYGVDEDGKEIQSESQRDMKGPNPGEDDDHDDLNPEQENVQPKESADIANQDNIPIPRINDEDDSHFFSYVTGFGLLGICLFLAYHHKHKIFAMLLEGRRSRGGRSRRRPSTANYRKLDCNLEEAVTSQCSSNVTHVIY